MKSIAILASGPTSPGRNRWLEIFNNKPCIQNVIEACLINSETSIYVILSINNLDLQNFITANFKTVKLVFTKDNSMLTTYNKALYVDNNDILIVAGDLYNLKKENIEKFLNSEYSSAIYRLKIPWGKHLVSKDKTLIRRGDIGDSLVLIANKHKQEYLSETNIDTAKFYFNKFYPDKEFNINLGNHLWTWLDYTFFFQISSSKRDCNNIGTDRGAIYIDSLVYLDND